MPLSVAMVDAQGKRIGEWILDTKDSFITRKLPLDDPSYPHLGSIDLYGDTTFNRLQIRLFLNEWKRWGSMAQTQEERELVRRVEDLANESLKTSNYLKFYGD